MSVRHIHPSSWRDLENEVINFRANTTLLILVVHVQDKSLIEELANQMDMLSYLYGFPMNVHEGVPCLRKEHGHEGNIMGSEVKQRCIKLWQSLQH